MATTQAASFTQASTGTSARSRIHARVRELGLERNVADLESVGYTVIEGAAPLDLFDRIRDAVVAVTEQVDARCPERVCFGPGTSMVYRLLAERDVFAEAVLVDTLTAVMTYLLGDGYCAQVTTGSVLRPGSQPGPLHSDNQFFPDPFPPQVHMATAIWCCDDFTEANGSTHVVPGSNRRYRHPRPGEALDEVVPVVAPRGSIVVWSGHTWHRSGGRTAPGERVALHTAFSRPHIRPFEAYSDVEIAHLVELDPRFARLTGSDLPYHYRGDTPDPAKLLGLAMTTQAQG
jgi:hypothetical protein